MTIATKSKVSEESFYGKKARNPVREAMEAPRMQKMITEAKRADRDFLALSIGDPTIFGNLKAPDFFIEAICNASKLISNHGYLPSNGKIEARQAVANYYSLPDRPLSAEDVLLTSGCSGALEFAFKALLNPRGRNEERKILIPSPAFALYESQLNANDLPFEVYNLYEKLNWEADIEELDSILEKETNIVAILINNPSNPMGTVYSKEYLTRFMNLARKWRLVVVADEVYGDLAFPPHNFFPAASITSSVPVISAGAISKEYLVPGFRLGWLIFHASPDNQLSAVRESCLKLSMLILGPCSLIQSALPVLLDPSQRTRLKTFRNRLIETLSGNGDYLFERFNSMKDAGGRPIFKARRPQGSMYFFVQIVQTQLNGRRKKARSNFCGDSVALMEELIQKEQVFVLAGKIFGEGAKDMIRLTLTPPRKVLEEACDRIQAFVERYF